MREGETLGDTMSSSTALFRRLNEYIENGTAPTAATDEELFNASRFATIGLVKCIEVAKNIYSKEYKKKSPVKLVEYVFGRGTNLDAGLMLFFYELSFLRTTTDLTI